MDTDRSDSSQNSSKFSILQKTPFVFTILNIPSFVQYFNMQRLGVSMRGLERDLGFSPKKLSCFILVEQISMIVFILIWGILCDLYDLKLMLIISVLGSGVFLIALGLVSNFVLMLLLIALNAAMSGFIVPLLQKYVVIAKMRPGLAFGIVHSVANAGRLIAAFSVTLVASNIYHGIFGWRLCCFSIGVACFLTSFTSFFVPSLKPKGKEKVIYTINVGDGSPMGILKSICKRCIDILSVKTIWLIIGTRFFAQGVYTSSYFITLLFQYCRFSNLKSGIATGTALVGSVVGGFIGGPISDYLRNKYPKYGVVILGIFLMTLRLFGFVFLLYTFDFEVIQKFYVILLITCFIIGLTFATIGVVDRPIAVDVVLPSEQGLCVGCIMMISSVTSCLVFPPFIGYLIKDVFGYVESKLDVEEMDINFVKKNAIALRNGIGISSAVSTTIMVILYSMIMFTYHKDAKKMKFKLDNIKMSKHKSVDENWSDSRLSTIETK